MQSIPLPLRAATLKLLRLLVFRPLRGENSRNPACGGAMLISPTLFIVRRQPEISVFPQVGPSGVAPLSPQQVFRLASFTAFRAAGSPQRLSHLPRQLIDSGHNPGHL